jgi:hypothetical protein
MSCKWKLEHRIEAMPGAVAPLKSPANYTVLAPGQFKLEDYAHTKGIEPSDVDPDSVKSVRTACEQASGPVAVHVWHVQSA